MTNAYRGSTTDAQATDGNRTEARLSVDIANAKFREAGTTGTGVTVEDLSRKGFKTEWPYKLRVGMRVWLTLPGLEPKLAKVRWVRGFTIGCEFDQPIHAAVFNHLLRKVRANAGALGGGVQKR